MAMNNNVVKADAMEKPAQSNNAKGGQQGATGEANGTKVINNKVRVLMVLVNNKMVLKQLAAQMVKPKLQRIQALVLRLTKKHSTTNPVAKPDFENSAVKVQHAGTKEDAHY